MMVKTKARVIVTRAFSCTHGLGTSILQAVIAGKILSKRKNCNRLHSLCRFDWIVLFNETIVAL